MFVFNIKVNGNKIFKTIIVVLLIIVLVITGLVFYKIFNANNKVFRISDSLSHSNITEINANNYTNILKATHENIADYIGKEIKFSGYIYRVLDFNENQFVLARDMIVNSQTFIVGFLCEYDEINEIDDGVWIEIIGTISKGKYHNFDIPVIKIKELSRIEKPDEAFVKPPDDTYIPTSSML